MPKYSIPDWNETSIESFYGAINTSVPIVTPMLLLFVFLFVFISGYSAQKTTTGRSNPAAWGTIAGVSTTMIALGLSTFEGGIDIVSLTVTIAVTILCGIWFFNSKETL